MEKLKENMKQILLNEYVKSGKILSFQEIQNIYISKGFSYYINPKDGKKKLRVRKALYPSYRYIRRNIQKFKKQRDDAVKALNCLLSNNIAPSIFRQVYKELEHLLTTEDKKFFKQKLQSKENIITL